MRACVSFVFVCRCDVSRSRVGDSGVIGCALVRVISVHAWMCVCVCKLNGSVVVFVVLQAGACCKDAHERGIMDV